MSHLLLCVPIPDERAVIARPFDETPRDYARDRQGRLDRAILRRAHSIQSSHFLDPPVKPEDDFADCFHIVDVALDMSE